MQADWFSSDGTNLTRITTTTQYNYVISISGNTIYARNISLGSIEFSGTDAGTVLSSVYSIQNRSAYVKAGTYQFSTNLRAENGSVLDGAGIGNTIFIIHGNNRFINITGTERIKIQDFTAQQPDTYWIPVIDANYSRLTTIKNVYLGGYIWLGIALGWANNSEVTNSYFYANTSTQAESTPNMGIWGGDNSNFLNIHNNYFQDHWLNAVFLMSKNSTISDNIFINNHRQTSPTGGGQIDITHNASNIIISGNMISGGNSGTSGVEIETAQNVTIVNNIITVPFYGIVSQDTYGASSNIIDGGNQITASIAVIDLGISGFGQYKWDRFEFCALQNIGTS